MVISYDKLILTFEGVRAVERFIQELDKRLEQLVEEVIEMEGEFELFKPGGELAKDRAFTLWCLQHLPESANTDVHDLLDAIVDGGDDKGIDAIYVPDKGQKLLVLQSKRYRNCRGKGVSKNELIKVFNGVRWLLEGDLSKVSNVQFRAKAEEFREAFQSFEYDGVKVVFATTAGHSASPDVLIEIEQWRKRFNESGNHFEVEILTLDDVRQLYLSQVHQPFKLKVEIDLIGKPYIYDEKAGARALVGTIKGTDLARLFEEHRHKILAANIRNYLGNVKINKGIQATAGNPDEATNFWFYNNGVTFVCDEFSFRSLEDARIKLDNAQIINGAQTVTSLWRLWKQDSDASGLSKVHVLVKIIEKKGDIDFRRKVTLYANSQNAVRASDFAGIDTVPIDLKQRLLKLGYYLETRRGDYRAEKEDLEKQGVKIYKYVTFKYAAQALAVCFEQMPAIAKSQTSKLFLVEEEGGYYSKIFWPSIDPYHVIVAVAMLEKATNLRKQLSSGRADELELWLPEGYSMPPMWLPHGDYFLAALFFHKFFDRSRIGDLEYLKRFKDLVEKDSTGRFREAYISLLAWVDEKVKTHEKEYGFSYPKFFKSQSEYRKLQNELRPDYASLEES